MATKTVIIAEEIFSVANQDVVTVAAIQLIVGATCTVGYGAVGIAKQRIVAAFSSYKVAPRRGASLIEAGRVVAEDQMIARPAYERVVTNAFADQLPTVFVAKFDHGTAAAGEGDNRNDVEQRGRRVGGESDGARAGDVFERERGGGDGAAQVEYLEALHDQCKSRVGADADQFDVENVMVVTDEVADLVGAIEIIAAVQGVVGRRQIQRVGASPARVEDAGS